MNILAKAIASRSAPAATIDQLVYDYVAGDEVEIYAPASLAGSVVNVCDQHRLRLMGATVLKLVARGETHTFAL